MKYRKVGKNGAYRNIETGIFVRPYFVPGFMTGDRARWTSHSVEGVFETRDALVRMFIAKN